MDSDFTVLATDIKSKCIEVIGFAEEKTPDSFKNLFHHFMNYLEEKTPVNILKEAIINTRKDYDYSNLSEITRYLKNKDSSFNPQNYGALKWGDIIKEYTKEFEIQYRNNKNLLFVCLIVLCLIV